MSHSEREGRTEAEALWLEKLHDAEHWYEIAIARTQRVLDEYDSMSPSSRDLVLKRALKFQNEAMDEYAEVFTQMMSESQLAEKEAPAKTPTQTQQRHSRTLGKVKPLYKRAGST
jgi:hypothetical protein